MKHDELYRDRPMEEPTEEVRPSWDTLEAALVNTLEDSEPNPLGRLAALVAYLPLNADPWDDMTDYEERVEVLAKFAWVVAGLVSRADIEIPRVYVVKVFGTFGACE